MLEKLRRIVQVLFVLAHNPHLPSLLKGTIYRGPLKGFCAPGLNCYSCPMATFACPLGALQVALNEPAERLISTYKVGGWHLRFLNPVILYVIGFLGLIGVLVGRAVCGWACPFGWFQEILYKIPSPKMKLPRMLTGTRSKFLLLIVLVILGSFAWVDRLGFGKGPLYCKMVCPAGTLGAGIPLILMDRVGYQVTDEEFSLGSFLRGEYFGWGAGSFELGFFFSLKFYLLVIFLVAFVFFRRPFCRAACPLGAIYGLFNRTSLLRIRVDASKCIRCDECLNGCPMDIRIYENPDNVDCIRCMRCLSCRFDAVSCGFGPLAAKGVGQGGNPGGQGDDPGGQGGNPVMKSGSPGSRKTLGGA
jgi:ferredoxin